MPVFDIYCLDCNENHEVISEFHSLKCPNCGSTNVRRRWTGSPMFRMKGDIQGETPGARKYAAELTRKLSKQKGTHI